MKLVFLLCAVLAVASAQFAPTPIADNTNRGVLSIVNRIISAIQSRIQQVQLQVQQFRNYVERTLDSLKKDAAQKLDDFLHNLYNQIGQSINDSNLSPECKQFLGAIADVAETIKEESDECIAVVTNYSSESLQEIIAKADEILILLRSYVEEARDCATDVEGFWGLANAPFCIAAVNSKATWAVTIRVPAVLQTIAKASWTFASLLPKEAVCIATAFEKQGEKYKQLLQDIKNCAKSSSPEQGGAEDKTKKPKVAEKPEDNKPAQENNAVSENNQEQENKPAQENNAVPENNQVEENKPAEENNAAPENNQVEENKDNEAKPQVEDNTIVQP